MLKVTQDIYCGDEKPFPDEDAFVCHRRCLHRLKKVSSSVYEGIFIKRCYVATGLNRETVLNSFMRKAGLNALCF